MRIPKTLGVMSYLLGQSVNLSLVLYPHGISTEGEGRNLQLTLFLPFEFESMRSEITSLVMEELDHKDLRDHDSLRKQKSISLFDVTRQANSLIPPEIKERRLKTQDGRAEVECTLVSEKIIFSESLIFDISTLDKNGLPILRKLKVVFLQDSAPEYSDSTTSKIDNLVSLKKVLLQLEQEPWWPSLSAESNDAAALRTIQSRLFPIIPSEVKAHFVLLDERKNCAWALSPT